MAFSRLIYNNRPLNVSWIRVSLRLPHFIWSLYSGNCPVAWHFSIKTNICLQGLSLCTETLGYCRWFLNCMCSLLLKPIAMIINKYSHVRGWNIWLARPSVVIWFPYICWLQVITFFKTTTQSVKKPSKVKNN